MENNAVIICPETKADYDIIRKVLELAPGALNGVAGDVVYPRAFHDIT